MTKKKIWIVDNEVLYLQLIERYLRDNNDEITTFLKSEDCLALIDTGDVPDLLIVDSQMPELDGYTFCEKVRNLEIIQPSVVLMSAREAQEESILTLACGGDYFLPKPIDKENLIEVISLCFQELDPETREKQRFEKYQACLKSAHHKIDEQKRQLQSLRQENAKRQGLLNVLGEHLTFGLLLVNSDGMILEAYGELKKPANESAKDLQYKNFVNLCPELNAFFYQSLQGEVVEYKEQKREQQGLANYCHYFIPTQENGCVIYLALDQSEINLLKQELTELHGYVNSGRLTERLIYDFRNILQVINGYTEILQAEFNDQQEFSHLLNISRAVDQARTLTLQMINHMHKPTSNQEYDANHMLEDFADFLRHVVGSNITLEIDKADVPCWLEFDLGQLTQVLTNLVLNARDSIGKNYGQIKISTQLMHAKKIDTIWPHYKPNKEYVQLIIEDNGCGIESQYLKNVFEPIYASENLPHGVGLGLSTVYRMITDNDGVIFCESEVGQGTKFTIYIESRRAHTVMIGEAANEQQYKNIVERNIKVLLVEGDRRVGALLKQSLVNYGFEVFTANTYEEAMTKIKEESFYPQIAVIDMIDGDLNFVTFAQELTAFAEDIYTIYTSAQAGPLAAEQLDSTKHAIIYKPFHVRELIKVILQALDISLPGTEVGS